ncbi:MAG TPA: adenylate/guanylate cyclase domain-containing protein [Dissulfurispiraceae bacterium]
MKHQLKKYGIRIGLGLAVTLVFLLHAYGVIALAFLDRLEALSYDLRLNLTLPNTQDPRIVIVDIDEKSLAEEGRWPWSRNRLALMMDKLFDRYHVVLVGFDVVFAEKDESSGLKVLEQLGRDELRNNTPYHEALAKVRPRLDYDAIFAQKMKDRPVVLGYYFNDRLEAGKPRTSGQLPPPVFPTGAFKGKNIPFIRMSGYGANLPGLQANAQNAGHFNPLPDSDGITRRIPMLIEYEGAYYEALSVSMVRALFGNPPLTPGFPKANKGGEGYGKLEWLEIADLKIPVDERVNALIPYRGGQGSFKYVSAADVLHDRVKVEDLDGAIVLVGTTSPGLVDMRATPMSPVYPGVEAHANMIAGILDQKIKHKPAYMRGAEVLTLLVAGLLLTFLLPFLGPLKSALASLLVLSAAVGINLWAWKGNMVLPLASSALMVPLISILNMTYGFFVESRTKRQITGLFGQYVPRELVNEMSRNPEKFTMEGESREMTVLFSDVRSFTTISEGLDPRELSKMMNEYMTAMTTVIQKHRGTIDKYIGDAIMAFWGAPLNDPEHARNSVLAALEMQEIVAGLRQQFAERGWPAIRIGVGLNTGVMNVGNMGSKFRIAYTVMGDAVNLGSRLEGLTKQYGAGVIVSETTKGMLNDFVFRELDRVKVKGKDLPVTIYEPLGPAEGMDKAVLDEVTLFSLILKHYRAMEWDAAEQHLRGLQEAFSHRSLYTLYLERIAYFRANPPETDWDGVFKFLNK